MSRWLQDFDDHRNSAREKQAKLKRELQTAINQTERASVIAKKANQQIGLFIYPLVVTTKRDLPVCGAYLSMALH